MFNVIFVQINFNVRENFNYWFFWSNWLELVMELRKMYGDQNVIASDIKDSSKQVMRSGPFETLDIMDEELLRKIVKKYQVTQIYLLAALLSATAEQNIELGWKLNMRSHSHVLDIARDGLVKKIFWPSSIAVFGPSTPKHNTAQNTIMDPGTVYGITSCGEDGTSIITINLE